MGIVILCLDIFSEQYKQVNLTTSVEDVDTCLNLVIAQS
jgi:hypothetical protein